MFKKYIHCLHVIVRPFFIGNIVVGDSCESGLQCTGSEHSELCIDGVCICQKEYLEHNNSCYPSKQTEAIILRFHNYLQNNNLFLLSYLAYYLSVITGRYNIILCTYS